MTARKPNKGGRPRTGRAERKPQVSVSRGAYRLVQAAAIARGVTMNAVVEAACRDVGVEQ